MKGEGQFFLLSRLEERKTAKSEIHGEKSKHPNKNKHYQPTPNTLKIVINPQTVKPAEGWRLLHPAGAAERSEEESPASCFWGVGSGPVSPPRLLLQN